jgi:hypothetical protein
MCHFITSCISIIRNTTKNSNTKPWEVEIHSQGQKILMYGTRVHAWPKAQIHMDKKNTKPQEAEIQSQGHKTLMYGTWMHVWPKAKIHKKKLKKNQTMRSWKSIHRDMKPMCWKKSVKILRKWTLFACFSSAMIGFFLRQSFLVDY